MNLIQHGIDGIVYVVGAASEKSAIAAGIRTGLNGARHSAEQAIALRNAVIDANIELVTIEGLASGEQIVTCLCARTAEIRLRQ